MWTPSHSLPPATTTSEQQNTSSHIQQIYFPSSFLHLWQSVPTLCLKKLYQMAYFSLAVVQFCFRRLLKSTCFPINAADWENQSATRLIDRETQNKGSIRWTTGLFSGELFTNISLWHWVCACPQFSHAMFIMPVASVIVLQRIADNLELWLMQLHISFPAGNKSLHV